MVNYVCTKTVPDSTKLRLIKGPKSKFPRGACPRTPLVCHMLCTQICACPSSNQYNLILHPPPPTLLGKKLKETLMVSPPICYVTVSNQNGQKQHTYWKSEVVCQASHEPPLSCTYTHTHTRREPDHNTPAVLA